MLQIGDFNLGSDMKIRMEISDEIYQKYKKMAENKGYAVTKLNQIIFEEAVKSWIVENELKKSDRCCMCGCELAQEDKGTLFNKRNCFFNGDDMYGVCDDCFENNMMIEQTNR